MQLRRVAGGISLHLTDLTSGDSMWQQGEQIFMETLTVITATLSEKVGSRRTIEMKKFMQYKLFFMTHISYDDK